MSYDEIIEHTTAFVTEAVFTLASPVGIPGADQATAAVQLSKNLGAFVKIQHNATNAIAKGAGVIKKAVPTVAEAIVEGVGIVGGLAKEGKELAGRTLNIVARNPKIAKAEGGVANAVKKVASIEKKIEEKGALKQLIEWFEKSKPGPGDSKGFQRYIDLKEDKIRVVFKNDTGKRVYDIRKRIGKRKVILKDAPHYNIEAKKILKISPKGNVIDVSSKNLYNYHVRVDKKLNILEIF